MVILICILWFSKCSVINGRAELIGKYSDRMFLGLVTVGIGSN